MKPRHSCVVTVPPTVLVVDDEAILAGSIRAYLEHYDYTTVVAHSGEDGLRVVAEVRPDVAVVVDIRLPGIDGMEVLRRIRRVSPTTKVVMVTAYASVVSAATAMTQGAFAYLIKPLDMEELRLLVDLALPQQ